MVYQTTPGLDPRIAKEGCYFRTVLRIFELLAKYTLSVEEVNKIFKACLDMQYIGNEVSDLYMIEYAVSGVIQIASGVTGRNVFGILINDKKKATYIIGRYVRTTNSGKRVTHFVLMPYHDNEVFDPWSEEGSRTMKIGKLDGERLIYAIAV